MSITQKLKEEAKAIGITALYFGTWIAALLLLKSLILAEYGVAFHQWSLAVVGALILSKVVLVLEHVPLGRWVQSKPALLDVALRTILYTLGVAIVLVLEKGFEGRHAYGGVGPAVRHLFAGVDVHHVGANIVCLSGALLMYNILTVIRQNFGKGALMHILLSPLPDQETTVKPDVKST